MSIKGLNISYATPSGQLHVLRDITVDIAAGEFFCILGPSACGKTTLLNSIAGLIKSEGKVHVHGSGTREKAKIGYVFQTPRLLDWYTIVSNVGLPLVFRGSNRVAARDEALHYLDLFRIGDIADKYPHQCSEGEKTRAACARALCLKPDLLLMDEPFAHLDEITARFLRKQLTVIWQEAKTTTIFVTHNIGEALFLGDRICLLTRKPSTIHKIYDIDDPRPRSFEARSSLVQRQLILREMEQH